MNELTQVVEWIDRTHRGDGFAFEQLMNHYSKDVFRHVYRWLRNEETAKDVTQEIFIKVFKRIKSFRREAKFSVWLFQITQNTCRDEYRKHRRQSLPLVGARPTEGKGQVEQGIIDQIACDREGPEALVIRHEESHAVAQALESLPVRQRQVIGLKLFEGLKMKDIADICQISEGTVKATLHQGMLNLRKMLVKAR